MLYDDIEPYLTFNEFSLSEYRDTFLDALQACAEHGFICEEVGQSGNERVDVYQKADQKYLGTLRGPVLSHPEEGHTKVALEDIFGGCINWPMPLIKWAKTTPWGVNIVLGHIRQTATESEGIPESSKAAQAVQHWLADSGIDGETLTDLIMLKHGRGIFGELLKRGDVRKQLKGTLNKYAPKAFWTYGLDIIYKRIFDVVNEFREAKGLSKISEFEFWGNEQHSNTQDTLGRRSYQNYLSQFDRRCNYRYLRVSQLCTLTECSVENIGAFFEDLSAAYGVAENGLNASPFLRKLSRKLRCKPADLVDPQEWLDLYGTPIKPLPLEMGDQSRQRIVGRQGRGVVKALV